MKKKHYVYILIIFLTVYAAGIIFFKFHFYFFTRINNVKVSACTINMGKSKINNAVDNFEITLIERDNSEVISGKKINMKCIPDKVLKQKLNNQNSLNWIYETIRNNNYTDDNLIQYDSELLDEEINKLNCFSENVIEPENAKIEFKDGSFQITPEVQGNKINKSKMIQVIDKYIKNNIKTINLDKEKCYEKPVYSENSMEVVNALNKCTKYTEAEIEYEFGEKSELLNKDKIAEFIKIDDNFSVALDKEKIKEYIKFLSETYDTYGIERQFKTSTNKNITIKGGNYGFKINKNEELKKLMYNIEHGAVLKREPEYSQKALKRGEDDIGKTYVEVNITMQHVWFYKEGKLITQGDVVTGNPARGNSTPAGVYGLNYKQKNAVLKGAGYSSKVKLWMPFNGNIGLHDASWRYSFGGNIYKNNGTHGCVNMPYYMAKKIYDNISENTPIICYKENE